MKMLEETRRRLAATNEPIQDIADRADVSIRWLYMVLRGEIADPGVNRVERVYKALANDPSHNASR
jgi:hypothetical protein